jgi:predicted transcriptional regulator
MSNIIGIDTPSREAVVPDLALERHYSVQEVSEMWTLSQSAVRDIFRSEPGVVRIERPRGRYERGYTTLRIPISVLQRVHRRMSQIAA